LHKNSIVHIQKVAYFVLFQICTQPVRTEEVYGNHRTILLGESAKRIASLLRV